MFQKKNKKLEKEIEEEKIKIVFQALENVISGKFHQYFDKYLLRFSKYFNAKTGKMQFILLATLFFSLLILILIIG